MPIDQPLTLLTTASAETGESHVPYCAAFELIAVKVRAGLGGLGNELGLYVHVRYFQSHQSLAKP